MSSNKPNRPITRSYAKSLGDIRDQATGESRSKPVESDSDLNATVMHIDEELLSGNGTFVPDSLDAAHNLSGDNIRSMISEVVQEQVFNLMSKLERSLIVSMKDTVSQMVDPLIHKLPSYQGNCEPLGQHLPQFSENFKRENNSGSQYRSLEIHRWNVFFSGDDRELRIDDFIRRVEHIAFSQRYSLDDVANNLYLLLRGPASNWYFQWVQRNTHASWQVLKSALEVQFRSGESDYDLEHRMMNRLQRSNETFDQFYNVMLDLNSRMRNPRSDRDLVEIMKRNVSSKMVVFIHNSTSKTLSEFLTECRRAEKNVARIEIGFSKTLFKPKVNEVDLVEEVLQEDDETGQLVEALNSEKSRSDIVCFDCKEKGHFAFNCTKKSGRVFCYRCGRDNYVISNCPFCAQGNARKNRKSGEPVQ